jgi:CDP-paratose 2-epimerase
VLQLADLERNSAQGFYNVGGGMENSVSLCELTAFCQEISGKRLEIGRVAETRYADVPYYVSDCFAVTGATGWKPQRKLRTILEDVWRWLVDNRDQIKSVLR